LWNLGIQWHVPSSEEVAFAFYLLDSFLQPELIKLQHCGDGELEMSRDDVLQSLTIVHNCLIGSGNLLPPLKGEPVTNLKLPSSAGGAAHRKGNSYYSTGTKYGVLGRDKIVYWT